MEKVNESDGGASREERFRSPQRGHQPVFSIAAGRAKLSDLPRMRAVAKRAWKSAYTRQLLGNNVTKEDVKTYLRGLSIYLDDEERRFRQRGRRESSSLEPLPMQFLLATRRNILRRKVVGFATIHDIEGCSTISPMFISSTEQGNRVRRKLWDEAIAEVRGRGHRDMRVFALANDTEAQQFYKTQGGIVDSGVPKGIRIGGSIVKLAVYSVHVPASQEDGEHVELLPDKGLLLETVPTTGTSSTPAAFLTIGIVLWAAVLSLARRHNDDSVKP